ncbi:hypothetical protein CEP53_011869 [Fusarium sp. AF-6]|nr:hypothetical protein CEP53_011869 [Fusarium sp. AF-6]
MAGSCANTTSEMGSSRDKEFNFIRAFSSFHHPQLSRHVTPPPDKPSTDIAKAGADAEWEGLVKQHRAAWQALKEVEDKMWEYRYRNIWPSTEE